MKNVLTQLTKSVLIPLELTAADTGIHKKVIGSGASGSGTTTLVTSNEEMKDIKKIVKCLEDSGLLFKEQRGGFLGMLMKNVLAQLAKSVFIP